jgi:hypothetical protein
LINKQSITIDWNQILTLIGLSGLITAGGGVLFKFVNDRVQSTGERQRRAVELKVGLYSTLIFHLERMIENPEFTAGSENPTKITKTRDDIDNLLKEKYYLVDAKSVSDWLYFRNHWEDMYDWRRSPEQKKKAQEVVNKIISLRNTLVGTFNNTLHKDYKKKMSIEIEKVDPEVRQKIILQ